MEFGSGDAPSPGASRARTPGSTGEARSGGRGWVAAVTADAPEVLWSPTPASIADSRLGRFAAWVAGRRGLSFGEPVDYDAVWQWSTTHLDQFWADVAT